MFLRHYFKEESESLGIPLKDFSDPLNNSSINITLNNTFLRLIFSNKKFKKDFFDYLDYFIWSEYKSNIESKFNQFF